MLKLLSIAALASTAIVAANSSVSAAGLMINHVGTARIGAVTNAPGGRFAPNTPTITGQPAGHEAKPRRWVCGPLKNWDGSWHCHWV
jgi:hypothetical protein